MSMYLCVYLLVEYFLASAVKMCVVYFAPGFLYIFVDAHAGTDRCVFNIVLRESRCMLSMFQVSIEICQNQNNTMH